MPENEIIGSKHFVLLEGFTSDFLPDGNLLLLTPIDPALLLIPILQLTHPVSIHNLPYAF